MIFAIVARGSNFREIAIGPNADGIIRVYLHYPAMTDDDIIGFSLRMNRRVLRHPARHRYPVNNFIAAS